MVTSTTRHAQSRCAYRRQQTLRGLLCSTYRNRRTYDRRSDIRWHGHYVDSHGLSLLIMALGVMLLSIADAYLTLLLLQFGAEEVNPFLNWLLSIDHQLFFVVKLAITGFCIVWLVMHQQFRVFGVLRVYHMLAASLLLYLGLICHQLDLLQALPIASV
ncbi:MAG: DUF5658 family protein [Acidiferrobacterales bacterium]